MKHLNYPDTHQQLSLSVHGIYAPPDDWKTTDQANPSLFSYTLRFFTFEIDKGKIYPRELTPKELREQEEKNKKGGKKETKKEEGNADQQRLKQQEEEERRREDQWSKLPEEDQKYRQFEDPFRIHQLRFENNNKSETLAGKSLVVFEERVLKDRGDWIYVTKAPSVPEQELAKLRKAKPKTLNNINDLNPVIMRAWVDYSQLNSQKTASVTLRCKLVQVDKTAQTPEPNLEKTYIKIQLTLGEPFIRGSDGVTGARLIADPLEQEVVSERARAVQELGGQIRLGIQSLAMQFSGMFWKQLNIYEEFKNLNYFVNKKGDITKRKEHFLYDFNVSGKYKILKDRLKKVIVHLCEKYFTQQMGSARSFTGVSYSLKDQFYSQIYTFLVTKYKEILKQLVFEKKENLNSIEVLSQASQKKKVNKLLAEEFNETSLERVERILEEYHALGDYAYGEKLYQKLMEEQPANTEIKYRYAIYCVKNSLKRPDQILSYIEEYLSFHKDDQRVRLEYLLFLVASQLQDNCKKAWVLLRQLIEAEPNNATNLALASLLFGQFLKMDKLSEKYFLKAERTLLKAVGKVPEDSRHQEAPIASQLPNPRGLPSFSEALEEQQKDRLWIEVLGLFINLGLSSIMTKVEPRIKSAGNIVFELIKLRLMLASNQLPEFEVQAKTLYQSSKSQQILDLIITYFVQHPTAEAEKYLKMNLTKASGQKQVQALLQLAYFYLHNRAFANARACVLKYLEKKPVNSGCSWRILGVCELELGNHQEALDSLKKANVSDTSNCQNWLWLAKVYAIKGNFAMCNQCINRYESINDNKPRGTIIQQISSILNRSTSDELTQQKIRVELFGRLKTVQAA